jgi:hypothetical protein
MKLNNLGLAAAGFVIAFWSIPYAKAQIPGPIYGASAGAVNAVSVTSIPGAPTGAVVAAVINSNRALEVIVWQDTGTAYKQLTPAPTPRPPQPTSKTGVAVTYLDGDRVVTADCDNTGVLSIDTWSIGSSGAGLEGRISTAPNMATSVSIASLSSTQVVTAIQTPGGVLALEAWNISSSGVPTLAASRSWNAIKEVAVASLNSNQVATAVRNSAGNLEVLVWDVKAGSIVPSPVGDVIAGPVSQVSIAAARGNAITSVINGSGDLEVIYWTVKSTGLSSVAISKDDTGTADPASQVATCLGLGVSTAPITAVCGTSSYLEVGDWTYALPKAKYLPFHTTSPVIAVALTAIGSSKYYEYFATASRSSSGDLQVEKWEYALPTFVKSPGNQ